MKWLVTLELPHENQSHSHIDVNDPAQAARVIRAIRESTGIPIGYEIDSYEGEWHCADCPAWRLELDGDGEEALPDRALPVRSADVLPLDQ